jgi:hypothetical protein
MKGTQVINSTPPNNTSRIGTTGGTWTPIFSVSFARSMGPLLVRSKDVNHRLAKQRVRPGIKMGKSHLIPDFLPCFKGLVRQKSAIT